MSLPLLKYYFDNRAPHVGPAIQDLWRRSASDPDSMRSLVEAFYPLIKMLSRFYARQTEQPRLAYDDFVSVGLDAFIGILKDYTDDYAQNFMTAAKLRINSGIFMACRDRTDIPPALAQHSYVEYDIDPWPQKTAHRNHEINRLLISCCEISPEEEQILREKLGERRTAQAMADERGVTYQAILRRVDHLKEKIKGNTPQHIVEEIERAI